MPPSSQMSRGYRPAGRHGAGKRPQKLRATRQATCLPSAAGWRQPRTSQHRQHRGRGGLRAGHGGEAAWKDAGERRDKTEAASLCVRALECEQGRQGHSATLPRFRAHEPHEQSPWRSTSPRRSRSLCCRCREAQVTAPRRSAAARANPFLHAKAQKVAPKLPLPSSRCPARREERREAPAPGGRGGEFVVG